MYSIDGRIAIYANSAYWFHELFTSRRLVSKRNSFTTIDLMLSAKGDNRGIGLNLVKALSAHNWTMVASVRPQTNKLEDPSVDQVLYTHRFFGRMSSFLTTRKLAETGAEVVEIDVLDESSIIAAAKPFGSTRLLDILINCAG